jgi:DNA (cytosine-5)-methyltransferase 3A
MFKQVSFEKPHRLFTIGKSRQGYRVYDMDGKSIALSAEGGGLGRQTGLYLDQHNNIRRLTINECEKLQTLPLGYCSDVLGVTDRQKYRAMGNGWTVDVIAHILKGIK